MKVLAVDTSTSVLHIALLCEDNLDVRMIKADGQHSEELLTEIKKILNDSNLTFEDLDLLVSTRGPGSFTSLRIGFATLKGISLALNKPLVSVPTLKAISEAIPNSNDIVISVLDAKKKRYYIGLYKEGKTIAEIDGNAEDILDYVKDEDILVITGPNLLEKVVASGPVMTSISSSLT